MASQYSYSSKLVSATSERIEIVKPPQSGGFVVIVFFFLFFPIGAVLVYQGLKALMAGQWGADIALILFGSLVCFGMGAFVVNLFKPQESGFVITPRSFEKTFRKPFGGRATTLLAIHALTEVNLEVKWLDFAAVWVSCGGEQLNLFEGSPQDCERVVDMIARMYGASVSLATPDFSDNKGGMIPNSRRDDNAAAGSAPRESLHDLAVPNPNQPAPPLRAFFPKGADHFVLYRKTGLSKLPIAAIQGFRIVRERNVGGTTDAGLHTSMEALVVEMMVDGEGRLMVGFQWDLNTQYSNERAVHIGVPPMLPSVEFMMRYFANWTGRPCVEAGQPVRTL